MSILGLIYFKVILYDKNNSKSQAQNTKILHGNKYGIGCSLKHFLA